jgi:hypothetical protein
MAFADEVTVTNAIPAGTAGTPSTQVVSVQGITAMTPIQISSSLGTTGGASYVNNIAPATPTVVTVKSGAGNVYEIVCFNLLTTPVFLKLYDVSGSVTLGSTAATFQYMIPGNSGGAGFVMPIGVARSFANAIKYAVTGGIALADNTAITASAVIVDISYN